MKFYVFNRFCWLIGFLLGEGVYVHPLALILYVMCTLVQCFLMLVYIYYIILSLLIQRKGNYFSLTAREYMPYVGTMYHIVFKYDGNPNLFGLWSLHDPVPCLLCSFSFNSFRTLILDDIGAVCYYRSLNIWPFI